MRTRGIAFGRIGMVGALVAFFIEGMSVVEQMRRVSQNIVPSLFGTICCI